MTYDLVIKNGRVVNAEASFIGDVAINGEEIAAVGNNLHGEREIDATGKLVTPGAVDIHVHMQMSLPNDFTSSDTFFTGTRAAAYGGTTAIVDFVECQPDEPMLDALARRRAEADPQVVIDYGLHMTIAPPELRKIDQFAGVVDAGCVTFKLYMAYGFYLDDGELLAALDAIANVGGLPVIHAENWRAIQYLVQQNLAGGNTSPEYHPLSRPAILEAEAAGRAIDLAAYAGVPLHVFHVGNSPVVERIAAARARGLSVTGETCPQYLALDERRYKREGVDGALPVCAPPLRPLAENTNMLEALADDHLQIIATDHCPFTVADKKRGLDTNDFSQIPGGVPSIEVRFPLAYSLGVRGGYFTENQWVAMCCTRPAQWFGFERKGVIAPGFDADIVIFDPEHTWPVSLDRLHENCDWTPYEGIRITGKVQTTLSRGHVIVEDGVYTGEEGGGRFVKRRLRV